MMGTPKRVECRKTNCQPLGSPWRRGAGRQFKTNKQDGSVRGEMQIQEYLIAGHTGLPL